MRVAPACVIALLVAGCSEPLELPPQVARGRHIDLHTDADVALYCVDDLLAREDRFVERTAAFLGVDPPAAPIKFVWDPEQDDADPQPWSCETGAYCYRYREDDGYGWVVSRTRTSHHELVHAVEVPALGQHGSQLLGEGLAEYLGSTRTSRRALFEFPLKLTDNIGALDLDYTVALHFVGSLLQTHGPAEYRALRQRLHNDATPDEFAATFAAVYGLPLADALASMTSVVTATDLPSGCVDGDALPLAWPASDLLDTRLTSTCGDGAAYIGVRDRTSPAASGLQALYTLDLPLGSYALTFTSTNPAHGPPQASLRQCVADTPEGMSSYDGATSRDRLPAGRYALQVRFPEQPETDRGEAHLRLARLTP